MDDKKKILILGTLFVVILGIGGFQFIKSGNSAPAPAEQAAKSEQKTEQGTEVASTGSTEEGSKGEATEGEGNKIEATGVDPALVIAAKLDPRDPFDGRRWDKAADKAQTPPPVAPQQPRIARPPRGISGGGFKPMSVPGMEGVLPEAGGGVGGPAGKLPSVDDFPYTVSGTMMGEKPIVVLTDQAGKQKIVAVGSQIDGDSEVVSISNGKVTVRHRGKTKTMPVGGMNPSNNKQEGNQ